jgi:aspartate/tyrosine/aromatic aminotransferase
MANRIKDMRVALVKEIKKNGNSNNWEHITN